MTQVEKEAKLATLDEQVLMLMIGATEEGGNTGLLTELSAPVNYLKSNMVVQEKKKSTIEGDTAERLRVAKERRKNNESK